MALTKADRAWIAELIAAAQAPAQSVVAAPAAADEIVHIGPSGKPDGRRFPCAADKPCGKLLRSAKNAGLHGQYHAA